MTITARTPRLVRPLRSRISPEFLFARLQRGLPGPITEPGWPDRLWPRSMSSARRMRRRVVGGVNEEFYGTLEDWCATAEALGLGERGRYILAATFGNVHVVCKPDQANPAPLEPALPCAGSHAR